jgi:ribosomal protein S18 acetylase RimI-like enzyme
MADTIRRAKLEDAPSVYAAWQRMRGHNHEVERRVVPAPVTQSEFAVDLEQLLARPRSAAFVAMRGKDLAGFIAGSIEESQPDRMPERHATVGYLWVEPQFRRQGLASQLFRAVADWAREQEDVGHFEMAVLTADAAAAGFWRSIGFSPFIERLWAPLSAPDRDE